MNENSRGFRDALGHFATGVAIVTARSGAGEPIGLTINSFASVSLDPPLVLWSLDRTSDRFKLFMAAEHFCVNTLGDECRAVSQRLSRKGESSLQDDEVRDGAHHLPILKSAIAHFECRVEHRHDGGDHVIFVGRVLDFGHTAHGRPLVYYRGRYRTLDEA